MQSDEHIKITWEKMLHFARGRKPLTAMRYNHLVNFTVYNEFTNQ